MKPCSVCKIVKPATDFQVRRASHDGRTAACRECLRTRDSKRCVFEREQRSAWYHEYSNGKGKSKADAARQGWDKRNAVKKAAAVAVNNAVRDGRLVKPMMCSRCPATERIHGHHPDYSKPLEVVWLCPLCHKAEHRRAA